jgi:hypothetical protein
MSASPLSATPLSSINASNSALPFDGAALVSSFSISPISALNSAARSGATTFLLADEDVRARLQQLQDKRSLLLKHIAQSERLAEVMPASRLAVRPTPEMISSGVAEVDAVTGGIPRGCLTEIWGGASSGKTSVLVAAMGAATRRGETCVLIDASDSFDPASAQAAGVNFGKLLWVRCGNTAIKNLNHKGHREKQRKTKSSEDRLEQVLKATDLILQSGGFGLIVLDLTGIEQRFVRRIPLASWFRFQRAVEHTKSALVVVSEAGCAQTCATLSLNQFSVISGQWSGKPAHAELLEGTQIAVEVVRSRLERKPSQSVRAEFLTQTLRLG